MGLSPPPSTSWAGRTAGSAAHGRTSGRGPLKESRFSEPSRSAQCRAKRPVSVMGPSRPAARGGGDPGPQASYRRRRRPEFAAGRPQPPQLTADAGPRGEGRRTDAGRQGSGPRGPGPPHPAALTSHRTTPARRACSPGPAARRRPPPRARFGSCPGSSGAAPPAPRLRAAASRPPRARAVTRASPAPRDQWRAPPRPQSPAPPSAARGQWRARPAPAGRGPAPPLAANGRRALRGEGGPPSPAPARTWRRGGTGPRGASPPLPGEPGRWPAGTDSSHSCHG